MAPVNKNKNKTPQKAREPTKAQITAKARQALESKTEIIEPKKPRAARTEKRHLLRWTAELDQRLLLTIQHVCNVQKIKIPWGDVAKDLDKKASEGAITQHIGKLRTQLEHRGIRIPAGVRQPINEQTSAPASPTSIAAAGVGQAVMIAAEFPTYESDGKSDSESMGKDKKTMKKKATKAEDDEYLPGPTKKTRRRLVRGTKKGASKTPPTMMVVLRLPPGYGSEKFPKGLATWATANEDESMGGMAIDHLDEDGTFEEYVAEENNDAMVGQLGKLMIEYNEPMGEVHHETTALVPASARLENGPSAGMASILDASAYPSIPNEPASHWAMPQGPWAPGIPSSAFLNVPDNFGTRNAANQIVSGNFGGDQNQFAGFGMTLGGFDFGVPQGQGPSIIGGMPMLGGDTIAPSMLGVHGHYLAPNQLYGGVGQFFGGMADDQAVNTDSVDFDSFIDWSQVENGAKLAEAEHSDQNLL